MTRLDKLLEPYIGGGRGEWYGAVEIASASIGVGYYYRKANARRSLRNKVLALFGARDIAEEFLEMKAALGR